MEPKLNIKIVERGMFALIYFNAPNIVLSCSHDIAQMFKSGLSDSGAKKELKEFFNKMVDQAEIEREETKGNKA